MAEPEADGYEEITLADLVRTLYRRKVILASVFVAILVTGVMVTAFTDRAYESEASVIPLEHKDIITNWLDSRSAAEQVATDEGDGLAARLFPSRWDDGENTWSGTPPSIDDVADRLLKRVSVVEAAAPERKVTIVTTTGDPALSRDIANAYVGSLDVLRPVFENITRQDAFDRYYDGSNEQQAQSRAEVTAQQKDYWLVLDDAVAPRDASSPNVALNLALTVVLGVLLAVFAVFFFEWASGFKAEAEPLPPRPETAPQSDDAGVRDADAGYTFRGR